MRAFSLGFGLPENYFAPFYHRSFWCLRLIRCVPPLTAPLNFSPLLTRPSLPPSLPPSFSRPPNSYPPVSPQERESLSSGLGCGEVRPSPSSLPPSPPPRGASLSPLDTSFLLSPPWLSLSCQYIRERLSFSCQYLRQRDVYPFYPMPAGVMGIPSSLPPYALLFTRYPPYFPFLLL
jgi:hypothetical protein